MSKNSIIVLELPVQFHLSLYSSAFVLLLKCGYEPIISSIQIIARHKKKRVITGISKIYVNSNAHALKASYHWKSSSKCVHLNGTVSGATREHLTTNPTWRR
jgi:hypothetical protein